MQRRAMRRRRRAMDGPVSCAIQRLEGRVFLSLSPIGGEILVNSTTLGDQRSAAIAVEENGDYVIAWTSSTGDGSGSAVFARRYTAGGTAQGSQFLVNTTTLNSQRSPAIAMDSDGDFVIAWVSSDGNEEGIFGQRFNGAGVAQGSEFRVNTYTTGVQASAAVAMDSSGDFVVAWTSYGQDGSYYGVYAQRYNASGVAQGTEFRVNNLTVGSQFGPSMAMNAAGDFVVSWTGYSSAAAGYDTYARRYNAAGAAQGGSFVINTYTTGTQENPTAAMDASGNFMVAWDSVNQDGHISGIYAKRYNAAGAVQGAEFKVNTYTTNSQRVASAAMEVDGDFVVTWASGRDGDGYGIYAQAYSASGVAEGAEFKVNTYTVSKQFSPAVAIAPAGDAVIAWESHLQDGSGYGIYAQRYIGIPTVEAVVVSGEDVLPYQTYGPSLGAIVVAFSEDMTTLGGAGGINSVTNPANWFLTRDGIDITTNITSINFGFNPAANRYEATVTLNTSYSSGNFFLRIRDNLRDISGNQLDGDSSGSATGDFLLPFSITRFAVPAGSEFVVNTYTTGTQQFPDVAIDGSGNYVVTWYGAGPGSSGNDIFARRYDSAGNALGDQFQVNQHTTSDQDSPVIATDTSGNFVIVWTSNGQDGNGIGVYARRYGSDGMPMGTEFRVNDYTNAQEGNPAIAMRPTGEFIVVYDGSQGAGTSGEDVYMKRFNAAGGSLSAAVRVNTFTIAPQTAAAVAVNAAGNFVVVWDDGYVFSDGQDGSQAGIRGQRFNASGVPQGTEFQVNTFTPNDQRRATVGMDSNGDFVVAWETAYLDGGILGVAARRYQANGTALGTEFLVNTATPDWQFQASLAMMPAGDFVVTWRSDDQDGSAGGIYAQRYQSDGTPRGSEFRVNSITAGLQNNPAIAMNQSGEFVIAWDLFIGDVYAQRFDLSPSPTLTTLAANPSPNVIAGNNLTLFASGESADVTSGVGSVSFYRESNGLLGLQVGASGDTFVGTTSVKSGGFWTIVVQNIALPYGSYTYWAQPMNDVGITGAPAATTSTVIAPPGPIVTAAVFGYQTAPQTLTFTFDRDVSATFGLGDVTLERIGGGNMSAFSLFTPGPVGTNTYTLTMSPLLVDGNYRATIDADGVTDNGNPMAADYLFDFFMLAGDANHDRKVDIQDLVILANNWQGSGKTYSQADFDYNGVVNAVDLGILAQRWQQTLAFPAPPLPAVATSVRPTRAPTRQPVRVILLVES